jgi:diketogulonate reductase-like aldo/keto reductase
VAIFQMILFFMAEPMHSALTKTTQMRARMRHLKTARSTPRARESGVSNFGRALIGAKHAQRSRGGQVPSFAAS